MRRKYCRIGGFRIPLQGTDAVLLLWYTDGVLCLSHIRRRQEDRGTGELGRCLSHVRRRHEDRGTGELGRRWLIARAELTRARFSTKQASMHAHAFCPDRALAGYKPDCLLVDLRCLSRNAIHAELIYWYRQSEDRLTVADLYCLMFSCFSSSIARASAMSPGGLHPRGNVEEEHWKVFGFKRTLKGIERTVEHPSVNNIVAVLKKRNKNIIAKILYRTHRNIFF